MDIYVYCMVQQQVYESFLEAMKSIVSELLDEEVKCDRDEEDFDIIIGCSIFYMYISTVYTDDGLDLSFIEEELNIVTNTEIYINVFSKVIPQGILLVRKIIERMGNDYYESIVVADHSSAYVYIKSKEMTYIDDEYWEV